MSKGFTLIEVIIALGIIVLGLIGVLSLINFTITGGAVSASKLIAVNLAQEGIEAVRNSRDSSADWTDWYRNISDGSYRASVNLADYKWLMINEADPHQTKLRFDSNTGLYFYTPASQGSPTLFSRAINIISGPDGGKQISGEVKWQERGRSHTLKVVSYLYNWRQ